MKESSKIEIEQLIQNYSFLITGGAGFIGSNLVEYLVKNNAKRVIVLDNLATGNLNNINHFILDKKVEFIEGDIRDPYMCRKVCEGIDFISHQAALGSVPRSIKDPQATNSVNIDGFLNMLVAAKEQGVKRFIYASSSSVYGDSPELPKKEDKIGAPLSPYAVTKKVNELYADVFSKTYGLQTIGLRYFNIFGPKQSPEGEYAALIPKFINAILNNYSPDIYGDGEQGRDFTYISNAIQANVKAMFSDNKLAPNKVYNIACGERITVNRLFSLLKEISHSEINVNYAPPRKGDIRDSLADISLAKTNLDYSPEINVREGLQKTFDWFIEKNSISIKDNLK